MFAVLLAGIGLAACSAETGAEAPDSAPAADAAPGAVYSMRVGGTEEWAMRDTIVAEVDGETVTVRVFEDMHTFPELQLDLNGDGTTDAIIAVNGGGNCCPSDYYFAAHRGGRDFTVRQIPGIYSWEGPELIEQDGETLVKFVSVNEGMNTRDFREWTSIFRFEGDMPVLVSEAVRPEMPALAELRSSVFEDNPDGRRSFTHDLNGDGRADSISCAFWPRWGRLSDCAAELAGGSGRIQIEAGCKRLGVVGQSTGRMSDLVCDADRMVQFDAAENKYFAR
ncbi:hypothetical protein [Hyphomonas sp.]|uniref:hypothetical protein n=1 Tax=Hyphomonas sp. TaxID=87 RepID=UPI00391CDE95